MINKDCYETEILMKCRYIVCIFYIIAQLLVLNILLYNYICQTHFLVSQVFEGVLSSRYYNQSTGPAVVVSMAPSS